MLKVCGPKKECEFDLPKSICLYTDTFLPCVGGAELVLDRLAVSLRESGQRVVVLAPKMKDAHDDADSVYDISRYCKPLSKRRGVRLILPRLIALHMQHRFDIIHCHAAYPQAYVAATFKRWFRIPFVVRPHGTDVLPGERIRSHRKVEKRMQTALSCADAIIAQGMFLKEVILGLGVDEKRVRTIHNGVDIEAFANGSRFDHPRPYILGLGNLMPHKGFDVLLRAYALLERPSVDLIIAGTGREQSKLVSLANQLGIASRVRFTGQIEGKQKVDLYRSSELFICPSRREPFANVILEAMASGLPIVAADVGGNRELVCHGEHGFLFPAGDEAALAATLSQALADPAALARFRQATARRIRDFEWSVIAQEYLRLYREITSAVRALPHRTLPVGLIKEGIPS